jgi:hypothetical protein
MFCTAKIGIKSQSYKFYLNFLMLYAVFLSFSVSPFPRDGDSRDVGKNIACPAIPKRHGSRRSSATPVCILPLGEGLGWGNASLLLSSRRRNVEEKFSWVSEKMKE